MLDAFAALDEVARAGAPRSRSSPADAGNMNKNTAKATLARLVAAGRVERVPVAGQRYERHRLIADASGPAAKRRATRA